MSTKMFLTILLNKVFIYLHWGETCHRFKCVCSRVCPCMWYMCVKERRYLKEQVQVKGKTSCWYDDIGDRCPDPICWFNKLSTLLFLGQRNGIRLWFWIAFPKPFSYRSDVFFKCGMKLCWYPVSTVMKLSSNF